MDYISNHLSWDKKTLLFPMCDFSMERMKVFVDDIAKFNPAWLCLAPSALTPGDRGILQSVPCPCGQKNQVLYLAESRECSFIVTASGRKISSFMLRSVAEYVNEEMSRCLEHIRFRQTGYDSMEVILGVKPAFAGWEDEVARGLLSKIEDLELKQMRWNFKFVDSCAAKKMI